LQRQARAGSQQQDCRDGRGWTAIAPAAAMPGRPRAWKQQCRAHPRSPSASTAQLGGQEQRPDRRYRFLVPRRSAHSCVTRRRGAESDPAPACPMPVGCWMPRIWRARFERRAIPCHVPALRHASHMHYPVYGQPLSAGPQFATVSRVGTTICARVTRLQTAHRKPSIREKCRRSEAAYSESSAPARPATTPPRRAGIAVGNGARRSIFSTGCRCPIGLIRFGVAPDHQSIKGCVASRYEAVALYR
jgi:hypothetical protein